MHEIRFPLGGGAYSALTALPRPPSFISGGLFLSGGRRKGRGKETREGKGKKGQGSEGRARELPSNWRIRQCIRCVNKQKLYIRDVLLSTVLLSPVTELRLKCEQTWTHSGREFLK